MDQQPQIDYDKLAAELGGFAVGHEDAPPEARPIATGGGRGTGLDVRKSDAWAKANAPAIGAMLGVAAGPAGLIASPLMAGVGGAAGSLARGDDAGSAAVQGIGQTGLEVGGNAIGAVARPVARALMRGTVPKTIAKNFDQVDIGKEMLERGVLPGSARSARRVARLSQSANAEREAASQTVPPMPRSKVVAGLRPLHAKAVAGREPEMAADVLEQMRTSARDIGPTGMSGPEALARKDLKQAMGKAALNAPNPRTAALGPQLADAERGAIVSHLRETPRMAGALDESQTLMAIDEVMKDAAHSNPITRARIGGATAAAMSPIGLGSTAHALNYGSKAVSPQMLRAIQIAMLRGDQ